MADTVTCPTLKDYLNSENCLENIGGTSSVLYMGVKGDLSAPMTRTANVYSTPAFKSGKGLVKYDLKDETQQVQGESQGANKGFNQTYNGTINAVNKPVSELTRAWNNLDIFLIIKDSATGDSMILYDPNKRVQAESGGIKGDSGAASGDDRQTTLEFHLNGVLYDILYVEEPEKGWDSLLASTAAEDSSIGG